MTRIKISPYLTDLLTVVPVPNVTTILFLVSEVKFAGRWAEELPCMQSLSVFVKGAWCPWYWIRVWRHIKRRRSCCCSLQWFVLKSILTACFTCLFVSNTAKLTELFRSVPVSCTECRDPVAFHSFLLGEGGPVFRTWIGYPDERFSYFFQFHEDITGIVPHIWPQLFPSIFFPTYFSLFILTSYVV